MLRKIQTNTRIQFLLALVFGFLFGIFLQKGRVTYFDVIIRQLLLQDFTVLKIMLSASLTGMIGVHLLKHVGLVKLQPKTGSWMSAGIGGLIFGVGFALLGYCQDVESVYDALDMFVLSSICDAMPFALLEAMAHELPAAGTTVGGVPEVIVPGETGFLAPPRDAVALAESMRPLLGSAELRQRLGRAGRARVVRHFHEADMVRKTLNVYRRILGPKDCRSGVRG